MIHPHLRYEMLTLASNGQPYCDELGFYFAKNGAGDTLRMGNLEQLNRTIAFLNAKPVSYVTGHKEGLSRLQVHSTTLEQAQAKKVDPDHTVFGIYVVDLEAS